MKTVIYWRELAHFVVVCMVAVPVLWVVLGLVVLSLTPSQVVLSGVLSSVGAAVMYLRSRPLWHFEERYK